MTSTYAFKGVTPLKIVSKQMMPINTEINFPLSIEQRLVFTCLQNRVVRKLMELSNKSNPSKYLLF